MLVRVAQEVEDGVALAVAVALGQGDAPPAGDAVGATVPLGVELVVGETLGESVSCRGEGVTVTVKDTVPAGLAVALVEGVRRALAVMLADCVLPPAAPGREAEMVALWQGEGGAETEKVPVAEPVMDSVGAARVGVKDTVRVGVGVAVPRGGLWEGVPLPVPLAEAVAPPGPRDMLAVSEGEREKEGEELELAVRAPLPVAAAAPKEGVEAALPLPPTAVSVALMLGEALVEGVRVEWGEMLEEAEDEPPPPGCPPPLLGERVGVALAVPRPRPWLGVEAVDCVGVGLPAPGESVGDTETLGLREREGVREEDTVMELEGRGEALEARESVPGMGVPVSDPSKGVMEGEPVRALDSVGGGVPERRGVEVVLEEGVER